MKLLKNLVSLILGHLTVAKHAFRKPVTLLYPEKKKTLNENFRGVHALVTDEKSNIICKGCGTCKKVCPAVGAIEITKAKNNEGALFVDNFNIDLSKCIFCGNCVASCPAKAIVMTRNFELANKKKSSLNLDINTLKNNYINYIMNNEDIG